MFAEPTEKKVINFIYLFFLYVFKDGLGIIKKYEYKFLKTLLTQKVLGETQSHYNWAPGVTNLTFLSKFWHIVLFCLFF